MAEPPRGLAIERPLPCVGWLSRYDRDSFRGDALAAVIVTIMLIPQIRHVVLICSAVNEVDASALEGLEALNERLHAAGIEFHLSEVKGPVMDKLKRSDFFGRFTGQVYLSQYDALAELDPAATQAADRALRPERSAASVAL